MLLTSCTHTGYTPKDCDLIFQVAEATDFSRAITDATAQSDVTKFDHVGMIVTENKEVFVLEATSRKGVVLTPFQEFVAKSDAGYIIKRVKKPLDTKKIISNAKSHLGKAYDWSFRPNNNKLYCSELIYESFTDENDQPIFHAQPMNFRDANGDIPTFWIDLFQKLGEQIPEGVMGTNPNDLSKEKSLVEVWIYLPQTL